MFLVLEWRIVISLLYVRTSTYPLFLALTETHAAVHDSDSNVNTSQGNDADNIVLDELFAAGDNNNSYVDQPAPTQAATPVEIEEQPHRYYICTYHCFLIHKTFF
jgi:hypothetical protein